MNGLLYAFIWIETMVFMPFVLIFNSIRRTLTKLGNSADFYAEHKVHWYQPRKALQIYNEQYLENVSKQLKEMNIELRNKDDDN